MESDTLKRFDRLVAILIQLQSKKIVKSKELADRFEVSLRTIYRDIQTLEKAGVSLYGEVGVGYSLVEGYRLPPVMFTREEASSFLAAEKLMQQFSNKSMEDYFESAMFKIKAVLRGTDKEWLTALEPNITVQNPCPVFNKSIPNALELLFESLGEKKQIVLNYHALNSEHPESRAIEPVGLFHENMFWYIVGYCHLRKDYRQFRLDRIQGISRSEKPFTRQHKTVEEYRNQERETRKQIEVKILADKQVSRYITSSSHYKLVSKKEKGSCLEITLQVPGMDQGFIRWLLMFSDYIQIIEPASLKKQIKEILVRAIAKLKEKA